MQNGDIILKIGKFNIKNIYSYMHALSQFSPGDTTTVTIKRKNKTLHLKVQF
jgi:S1-C subfamily serine protease